MTDNIIEMQKNTLIMNHINDGLIIPTASINELWENNVKQWLLMASTGAIICSRPRVGKTVAIDYLANKIDEMYDGGIPVIKWNITNHAVTERNFYSSLLMAMGDPEPNRGATALVLKNRVLNVLTELATVGNSETMYSEDSMPGLRRIVLFCDEAYLLDEKDFNWLMDLYNNLRHNKVYLTTFLVGTDELQALKAHFISLQKDRIIGRFMIDEHEFAGIRTKEEMALCLSVFDSEMKIPGIYGERIIPSQHFFPEAYDNGEGLYSLLTDGLWDVFQDVKEKSKIPYEDIPMKYFIRSIMATMTTYGKYGIHEKYFLNSNDILEAVISSGYAMSGGTGRVQIYGKKTRNSKK